MHTYAGGRSGSTAFRRKSTSLPGFSWWLESMKRMSPGPSAGKAATRWTGVRTHSMRGFDRRSRLRVDRRDARIELAVGDGARHEARRVAAANLDDAPRPCRAHHRVGGSGVEARKPVLVPARGRGLGANRFQIGCVLLNRG